MMAGKKLIRFLILLLFSAAANANIDLIVAEKSKLHGVDEKLVKSVIRQESGGNPRAVSSAGAVGVMQLMPATAKRFGCFDRYNAESNIDSGVRYLRFLLDMFNGDLEKTVASYNAGEGAVIRYGGIPPYAETQNYVKKVLGFYHGRQHTVIAKKRKEMWYDRKLASL